MERLLAPNPVSDCVQALAYHPTPAVDSHPIPSTEATLLVSITASIASAIQPQSSGERDWNTAVSWKPTFTDSWGGIYRAEVEDGRYVGKQKILQVHGDGVQLTRDSRPCSRN
jgi:hypothetical protein